MDDFDKVFRVVLILLLALTVFIIGAFVLEVANYPIPIGNCYDPPNGCQ
jgi:hypothetical protein